MRPPQYVLAVFRAGYGTFDLYPARYLLCSGADAARQEGSALSAPEAARIVAALLRSDAAGRLLRIAAELSGVGGPQQLSEHDARAWFARACQGGLPRLVVVQLDGSPAASQTTAAVEPSPAQRVVGAIAASSRSGGALNHRGQQYRLALVAQQHREPNRAFYEAVSPREAQAILQAMSQAPVVAPELRALFSEAAGLIETGVGSRPSHELVLLRRLHVGSHVSKAEPTVTPSQLRKAKESQWIEIRLLDGAGEPMAYEVYEIKLADGSTTRGSLDEDGLAYLAGIVPGQCQVTFPGLMTPP